MKVVTPAFLTQQLELADQLLAGRETMLAPQDQPGRYGGVFRAVDHLLEVIGSEAALAGGWAVWRHGFVGRVSQDLDIVLPAVRVDDFLQAASLAGFELLPQAPGRWPKVRHTETDITVDIWPEGGRPGTAARPAPTTTPHPAALGAASPALRYAHLPALIELKLAAGRIGDEHDVVELIRANPEQVESLRRYLAAVHCAYLLAFDRFVERAREHRDCG
jgi:hypothetical protein